MAGRKATKKQAREPSRILTEVEAILSMALGIVLALSFVSYAPDAATQNHVGPVGYWLADKLVQCVGLAAYLVPLVLMAGAAALLMRRERFGTPVRLVGALAFLLESAILLGLYRPERAPEAAGGWLGGFVAVLMRESLGLVGSSVVLAALVLLTWLMLTATPLSDLLHGVAAALLRAWELVRDRARDTLSDYGPALVERLRDLLLARRRNKQVLTAEIATEPPMIFGNDEGPEARVVPVRSESIVQITKREPIATKKARSKARTSDGVEQEEFSFALENDDFRLPPIRLLGAHDDTTDYADEKTLLAQSKILEQKLATFGVSGRCVAVRPGPVITTFEFEPDAGIKVSRVVNLSDDLTMALRAHGVRIVAPIPGKNVVGIEVSNRNRAIVGLRDLIENEEFSERGGKLPLALGRDTTGLPSYADLSRMPHLLMAGATGAGKSVSLNAMILSLLYSCTARDCRFIMIDPKMLELSLYEGIPHLLVPVVTDVKKAAAALANVMREMDRRFELMASMKVRNIDDYNAAVADLEEADDADEGEEWESEEASDDEAEWEDSADEEESEEQDGEEWEDDSESDDEDWEEVDEEDGLEENEEYEEDEESDGEEDDDEEESEESADDEDEEWEDDSESDDEDDEEESDTEEDEADGYRHEHLPRVVVIVDELADLMMVVGREIEVSITRLAQKARAAGIHLILATQRPSVDVITGLIKANFPCRISFQVTSRPDSRTILDSIGSERLLGMGDMLYLAPGTSFLRRLHGPYISDKEIREIVKFLKKQGGPEYHMELLEMPTPDKSDADADEFFDELYDKAVDLVLEHGQGSTSWVQRKLGIGYNRAARIMEHMEREGVVGPADGARPRKVLVGSHAMGTGA